MLQMKNLIRIDCYVSMLMCFTFGRLYGGDHPDINYMVWFGIIFIGACAKIWLHHQISKTD